MDNLQLGPEAQVNHTVAVLRGSPAGGPAPLARHCDLVPGAFLSIGAKTSRPAGSWSIGGGSLLRLEHGIDQPDWIALHLRLGPVDLTGATVLGLACKSRAAAAATFRICLRSGVAGGFADAFLPKHAVAFATTSTHVDLLRIENHAEVPGQAEWRELILFFQSAPASYDIHDLRVFIV